jgi:hypothetical protein
MAAVVVVLNPRAEAFWRVLPTQERRGVRVVENDYFAYRVLLRDLQRPGIGLRVHLLADNLAKNLVPEDLVRPDRVGCPAGPYKPSLLQYIAPFGLVAGIEDSTADFPEVFVIGRPMSERFN